MSDRQNRLILTLLGLLLVFGGGLSAALGAGLFGTARSNRAVFDATVIRWWNEGGWKSFATVAAIGAVAAVLGALLAWRQPHRNDGRTRTPTVVFPAGEDGRGETTLRSAALTHNLEADLQAIPDVHNATVGLFGRFPAIELRAVLAVGDSVDLERLPARVDHVLARMHTTTGTRPDPVQITIRFKAAERQRQLR
jgi:hypothetical protein